MDALLLRVGLTPSLTILAFGLLAGCGQNDAPDDVVRHPRPPEIARIVPAEEALANAEVAKLNPTTMNDAEIHQAVGTGPRCEFRYTNSGKPVLAVSARPDEPPLGGVVKVNGHRVLLKAAPIEGTAEAADNLLLTAGPIRMRVTPDRDGQTAEAGGVLRREADLIFEVGQSLRAGYRGYLSCAFELPIGTARR